MVEKVIKTEKTITKKLRLFIFVSVMVSFTFLFAKEAIKEIINEIVKTEEKTEEKTHGNSDDNCRLHIVYEIYAIDSWQIKRSLKYGISSQCDFVTKDGNPRPEYQVPIIQHKPKYKNSKVWYKILHKDIPDRKAAKSIEQELVNEYFYKFQTMPAEQLRPTAK